MIIGEFDYWVLDEYYGEDIKRFIWLLEIKSKSFKGGKSYDEYKAKMLEQKKLLIEQGRTEKELRELASRWNLEFEMNS